MNMRDTKYIVVTGGVLSGLGKGVVSSSIAKLFSTSYKIVTIKCDGYLNVDPGTMNPIEHGEVFVLDDGGEVDLDFGHYERVLNINAKFNWNLTSGKIFSEIIDKERRGDFLGKTVQMIPHVTDCIKEKFYSVAKDEKADIVMIEMGGTVGDIEMMLFNEAARQLQLDVGRENVMYVHLTYVPQLSVSGEQKTKPTQQSLELLRKVGIVPDIIIGRSEKYLEEDVKKKIALFGNVDYKNVISNPDVNNIYEIPLIFQKENLFEIVNKRLGIKKRSDLSKWKELINNMIKAKREINIAICGKYTKLSDSYISILEALKHVGAHLKVKIKHRLIESTDIKNDRDVALAMNGVDGVIVPGGFGSRGTEGKIKMIGYARKMNIPFLGICLGMQLAVIEFARNVCGLESANSTEFNKKTPYPVIDFLPGQAKIMYKGGTMRLGGYDVMIKKGTRAYGVFKKKTIRKRFRHRYEVNPKYIKKLEEKGFVFSGCTPKGDIMQISELSKHKFFIGGQFHPELTSRFEKPSELFYEFIKSILL